MGWTLTPAEKGFGSIRGMSSWFERVRTDHDLRCHSGIGLAKATYSLLQPATAPSS